MVTQEISRGGSKKFQKSYFNVLGLCCSSEVPLVENILKSLDGVKQVSVIVPSRTVIVVHDALLVSQIHIAKALNQAGLEANVRVYGDTKYHKKWPSPYAVICGLLLLLSFLKYVFHPLKWLPLGAVAIGVVPIICKAIVAIRNLRLEINVLVLIAVIGTIAMGDYLEAGTIVFLFTIAEWLETRASHKATAVMSSLMSLTPQKATIAETGEVVDVDCVKLNTVVAVKAGEIIPIDGIVVEGKCEVDERTLTGESFPVVKENDSMVWAGTINLNGYISVKTTAVAEDCVVAKMAKLVEDAQNKKSKAQRLIDSCARFYTPAIVVISACLAVIPAALRLHNRDHWFHLALVVLVSACPCALILSTPTATFCALSKAAKSGVLIKGGDYLEVLAKIKMVAFDKTGTITRGDFVITNFRSLQDDLSLNTLIYWVSSIESKSSHPMAAAIVNYSRSLSIEPKPENVKEFENFPGEGIHGRIDDQDIYIGNRKIVMRAGCGTVPVIEGDTNETIGYIYSGEIVVGMFSLSDSCRSGVVDAIDKLKLMGIKTAMLTGDSNTAAMHAQDQIGHSLEAVHSELLPEDKLRIIEEFKKERPTAMVGDGLNDAPALATADIGISMGISGSALATETGHIILMSNDIRKIPQAIQLARKARIKVIQNVVFSLTTKAAIIALALAGHPLVWAAVLADVGTCLLVILNSMLLLPGTHHHHGVQKGTHEGGGKCCKSSATPHRHQNHYHKTGGQHQEHKYHNCCSHKKSQNKCEPQKSSSSESCKSICQSSSCHSSSTHGSRKCDNILQTNERHHNSVCADKQNLPKECDHVVNGEKDVHKLHNHSHSGPLKVEYKHHGSYNMVNNNAESCSVNCHSEHSKPVPGENTQTTDISHCQYLHCHGNEQEQHSLQAQPDSEEHHSAIDIDPGTNRQACIRYGKRETEGCCKSYLKECCHKNGNFGAAGFVGGGLSEIITE